MKPDFTNDLPLDMCVHAYTGYSFFPEKTGASTKRGYEEFMSQTYDDLLALAQLHGTECIFDEMFPKFHEGYKRRYVAYLQSSSRCMSTMIAGPSNFPVDRQRKRYEVNGKRCSELCEYQSAGVSRIRWKLIPSTVISSSDENAVELLITKIGVLEAEQEQMKKANSIVSKTQKKPVEERVAALLEIGVPRSQAMTLLSPDFAGRYGYASYNLTNNNANIVRLKGRIKEITQKRSEPTGELEGEIGTVELAPDENRVRLKFTERPDRETCQKLKQAGFRWAPSLGVWSSYHNYRAVESAKQFAGVSA